ncbi:pyrophosphatase PpaX [Culicoidibacter larvae]|uniref:Pyrophosphatase PpaX n=1 Tax=Culicoidibacter larvae TaxID=2579976 RepID=A0A5R8QHE8_9FIRM|nr:pyrophosphatase PpaX [Culicoidibacter larvae]TLG77382.1 pyrophosphatase PpaX [Culicoidibacter larvae]
MYDTYLFDVDGTLLDTNELILNSFEYVLKKYFPARTYDRKDLVQFTGPTLIQSFSALNPEHAEQMVIDYRKYNLEHHDEMVKIFPNVELTLEQLKQDGKQLSVVSSKKNDVVMRGLKLFNIDQYFDIVIGADDVEKHKPEPEPLLKALQFYNEPNYAIMIGDNSHDIDGAKNAGIDSVGVAWSLRGRDFIAALQPTYVIDDMKELLNLRK